jgi:hypothetical protein
MQLTDSGEGRPCHRRGSGGEARGGRRAPVGGHGSSRGGSRRRGHTKQWLTAVRSPGRGAPTAFGLGETAQGMEGDEVDTMALTTGFAAAARALLARPWRT